MKKLLMKWFPKWFHVCVHYEYDFSQEERNSGLNIAIADEEADSLHKALAISETRAEEIMKACQIGMIKHELLHYALDEAIRTTHHANEQVFAVMTISHMHQSKQRAQVIIQHLTQGGQGQEGGGDE